MEHEPVEEVAELVHEIWANWMKYMFEHGEFAKDTGAWFMPASKVERWSRQLNTPYSELSEKEKDTDREIAIQYLDLLRSLKND